MKKFYMKKRALLGSMLLILSSSLLIAATYAYLNKVVESKGNHINSAKFQIETRGVIGDGSFDVGNLAPGQSGEYNFEIDKKDTSVNIKYTFDIEPGGELFDEGAAIQFKVYQIINEGSGQQEEKLLTMDEQGQYLLPLATAQVEKFKLLWEWIPTDNDNPYQGKGGTVTFTARADQIPAYVIFPMVSTQDSVYNPEIDKVTLEGTSPQRRMVIYEHSAHGNLLFIEQENNSFLCNDSNWHLEMDNDGRVTLKMLNDNSVFFTLDGIDQKVWSWFKASQEVKSIE